MTDEAEVGQQKHLLAADYDSSSQAYEAHWAPVLANLTEKFVNDLPLSDAETVLDVGAGTGSTLRYLLRTTRAMVVGIDRSQGMLQRGPPEAARAVMDAERLAFQHESFDVAVAMFVLFHLPDPASALREVRRALRSRGTVAFTTWGDTDVDFRGFDIVDEVMDRYGAVEGRDFYARYDLTDTPAGCRALLEETGFEVSSVRTERMAHRWAIEHLIGFRTEVGYGHVRWASLDADERAAVTEEASAELAELGPDDTVLRYEVIYSIGTAAG